MLILVVKNTNKGYCEKTKLGVGGGDLLKHESDDEK